jgi:hypothetical protein
MEQIKPLLDQFKAKLDTIPQLQKLEDKTKVKKEYWVGGAGAALFLFFLFGNFAGLLW